MDREVRSYAVNELRIDKSEKPKIFGHAVVFDAEADIGGMFRERVARGALHERFANADIRALFNHDPNIVLGRNKNGTLRLSEDDVGLAVEIQPPDTQAANDLLSLIERGDISQMSFAFRTLKQEWDDTKEPPLRTILKAELFDVSPVTFAAYPQTDVAVRELAEFRSKKNPIKRERKIWPSLEAAKTRLKVL